MDTITDHDWWTSLGADQINTIQLDVAADGVGRAGQFSDFTAILSAGATGEVLEEDVDHVYTGRVGGAC